jgi:hypothetical protein
MVVTPVSVAEGAVDPFTQFFTGFEKRESFGFDQNPIAGFWVTTGVALVFFDKEAAQPSDFNAFSAGHGFGHVIKKYLYNLGGLSLGHIGFGFQSRDEFQFIHTTSLGSVADQSYNNIVMINQMQVKSQGVMVHISIRRL